jgi:hypothetical protein
MVYPQFGANFDSRFFSCEAAKNAKEKLVLDFLYLCLRKFLRRRNSTLFAFFAFFA